MSSLLCIPRQIEHTNRGLAQSAKQLLATLTLSRSIELILQANYRWDLNQDLGSNPSKELLHARNRGTAHPPTNGVALDNGRSQRAPTLPPA